MNLPDDVNLDKIVGVVAEATAKELPVYLRALRRAAITGAKAFARSLEDSSNAEKKAGAT